MTTKRKWHRKPYKNFTDNGFFTLHRDEDGWPYFKCHNEKVPKAINERLKNIDEYKNFYKCDTAKKINEAIENLPQLDKQGNIIIEE